MSPSGLDENALIRLFPANIIRNIAIEIRTNVSTIETNNSHLSILNFLFDLPLATEVNYTF